MFKDVPNSVDFIAQEHNILKFWRDRKVFNQLKTARRDAPRWSFIDGPILPIIRWVCITHGDERTKIFFIVSRRCRATRRDTERI